MKRIIILLFVCTELLYSQGLEGYIPGTNYLELKSKIPSYAEVNTDFSIEKTMTVVFISSSLGFTGPIHIVFYKDVLISVSKRYPDSMRQRIINALKEKYGDPIYKDSYWVINDISIIIFELETTNEIMVTYDLLVREGKEFRERLETGGNSKEDSSHF